MNILFIGTFYTDALRERIIPDSRGKVVFSNDIFERNILTGLSRMENVSVCAVTLPTVGSYPLKNRKLFTPAEEVTQQGIPTHSIGYCNLWPWFVYSGMIRLRRKLKQVLRSYGDAPVKILLCAPGGHIQRVLRQVLDKMSVQAEVTIILPDVPVVMNETSTVKGLRGWARYRMSLKAMQCLQSWDKYVLLTRQMTDFIPPDRPYMVMEGLVDEAVPAADDPEGPVVSYTGVVDRQYGLGLLLDAFPYCRTPGARLWIAGSGPMAEEWTRAAASDPRIRYFGLVSPEEAARIRAHSAVLVNPRTSEGRFTRYSFPSKTLEYLLSGKPVVANMLPGIPEEYRNYLIVPEKEDAASLAAALDRALSLPAEERMRRGEAARTFVREHKSCTAQVRRILDFLQQ